MYNPNYAAFNQAQMPQGFIPNMMPGQQPQTPQAQQFNPNMMYNPQQFPQGAPFGAPPNGMAANPAMMPNNGMAPMGGAGMGMPNYQTPYAGSPYGGTPGMPGQPQNFMAAAPNPGAFGMSPQSMPPQQPQPQQRMQQRPTSTPGSAGAQRMSPFPGQHNTPPQQQAQGQMMNQMPTQFSTPPTPTPPQNPPPTSQPARSQGTPQTPNFPPSVSSSASVAQSKPVSDNREKERVTLLLEINSLLLMETLRLRADQKEGGADGPASHPPGYSDCMLRLQANLSYLATIADRSNKPGATIPPHPAIMTAPNLGEFAAKSPSKNASAGNSPSLKKDAEKADADITTMGLISSHEVPHDRDALLKEHYTRLQSLFPGADTKKDAVGTNNMNANRPPVQSQSSGKMVMPQQAPGMQDVAQMANMNANAALQAQMAQLQQANAMRSQGIPNANMMNAAAMQQAMRGMQGHGGVQGVPMSNAGMMPGAQMTAMMPQGAQMSQQPQQTSGQMMR